MRNVLSSALNRRFCARLADADKSVGELYLYDAIGASLFGGITPNDVLEALQGMKQAKTLSVFVNSPGGDVFDGVAIYNLLKRFDGPVNVFVDGVAASIASVIAMAGDSIATAHNATWMIHDPWGMGVGTAGDLRALADTLDTVRGSLVETYTKRTGQSAETISQWMADETWMDARTAQSNGFTDTVIEDGARIVDSAFPLLDKYGKTPPAMRARASAADVKIATMESRVFRNVRRASLANSK